ncbi:hypothetical protein L798_11076 [Zootermopsis nevadensis]|uniref:Uncharacterized protein n=1 Tax=Zootermopsis nevadensis TaxID=136037 RepID=A0A067QX38_ZOONE|nr:hypothetical protein L798_11076 [Zootermopsis nevadensis]
MPVWRRQPRPVEKVDVNTNGDQSGVALPLQPEVTPSQKHDTTFKIPQVPKEKRRKLSDSPAPPDGVKPASHSPVVSASTSDCALKTESSIRMSQKRKHNSNSEGSTVLPKKHCPSRSSDSKTLLKITQKVDKEGRQLKRRYSYDDKSAQSCEEVQPHRLSTKRRKTM